MDTYVQQAINMTESLDFENGYPRYVELQVAVHAGASMRTSTRYHSISVPRSKAR